MKVAMFDTHVFEKKVFEEANTAYHHSITYFEARLNWQTAPLAHGFPCVCCFVNDQLDSRTLELLNEQGTELIALRSAGYNNVDLEAAEKLGLIVVRVPAYSPYAVAEHAAALLMSLNRKIFRAYNRVRDWNFSLEGLVGFDLHGKTVGVIGTGKIGSAFARIMKGFGCQVLAYDRFPDLRLVGDGTVRYVGLPELYASSDIISLHSPLTPETWHMINAEALARMKPGVILLNTGRGALIDSQALVESLKSGHIGGAGLDVYEEEEGVFFLNLSDQILKDDTLARLLTFPNVLITSHQAFLTREALSAIAETTLRNIADFEQGNSLGNRVLAGAVIQRKTG